jgi:hypothetical protein
MGHAVHRGRKLLFKTKRPRTQLRFQKYKLTLVLNAHKKVIFKKGS